MRTVKSEEAYTLAEIVVAALFIAIALITIASAFTNSSAILQKSRHSLTALGYLQDCTEYIRNLPFSSITSSLTYNVSSAPLPNPSFSITVENIDADNADLDDDDTTGVDTDIKKVSLSISWNEAGKTLTKKTATLVMKKGINPDE